MVDLDNIKDIEGVVRENFEEWNNLVKDNSSEWMKEYYSKIKDGTKFWSMPFSEYLLFKVFEKTFSNMIDEAYADLKDIDVDDYKDYTREEMAMAMFFETISGDLVEKMSETVQSGGIA